MKKISALKKINVKIIHGVLLCLIFNLSLADEKQDLKEATKEINKEVNKDVSKEASKQDTAEKVETPEPQNKEDDKNPTYVNKNITAAIEQLRNEKDQLQIEFEKLQQQQSQTYGLINENKKLKEDIALLMKFKQEVNDQAKEDKAHANTQAAKTDVQQENLGQALKKIETMSQEIALLTQKVKEYEAPKNLSYTIKMGDTLPKISQRACKNLHTWQEIYRINTAVIKNPNALIIGTKILLPSNCINEKY